MKTTRLPLSVVAVLLCLVLASQPTGPAAAEDLGAPAPIRLAGSYALTPDGNTLLFSWRGDLWSVPSTGGSARRLTFHPARDTQPAVSPDGKRVAFVSNRSGSDQIWTMPLDGGVPRRITTHTEGYRLYGYTPDGKALLARLRLDHDWRRPERFVLRPLAPDAKPELLFNGYGGGGALSPDGKRLAFTREGAGTYRKGYRGSQASQVWIHDLEAGTFERITTSDTGERWPLWTPDGRSLLLTTQDDGTWNLWRHDLGSGRRTQLTRFEDDGVVGPAISSDGSTLVFRRLVDTWRLDLSTSTDAPPRRLEILDSGDPTVDPVLRRVLSKAREVAFTDDAREIAFTAGGDLWVMDTELREPRRVTRTPGEEREPVFSADFKTLYFVRETDGRPDVWTAKRRDEAFYWWQNDAFDLERLTDTPENEYGLRFTPDGKRLAYVRSPGTLVTLLPDGSEPIEVFSSWTWPQFSFSPDGHWVAYAVNDDDFNRDVWIKRADGTGKAVNVSRHPDSDTDPAFSPDGRLLAFSGRRWDDERDVCYVWLRREDEERDKRDRTVEKALEKMKGRKAKAASKGGKQAGKGQAGTDTPPGEPPAEPDVPPKEAPAADKVAGTWRGTIQGQEPLPPQGLELIVVLTREKDGALSGTLEVPGQFEGPLESFSYDADGSRVTLAATTPLGPLSAEGTLEGDRMQGTWAIEGVMTGTWELTREAEQEADAPDAPEESASETASGEEEQEKEEREPMRIDFEAIEDRVHRIAIPNSAESGLLWAPDGKKLAFRAEVGGQSGLYTVTFPDDLKPKRLTGTKGRGGRWLKEGNQIVWLAGGLPATLSASGKAKSYAFRVNQEVDQRSRHAEAFDIAWRVMRDAYYDERLGNRDWDAVRAKYRPHAAASVTPEELDTVVDMMLGELNGSHLGFAASSPSWSRPGWKDETGHLGARFDDTYDGPGLRVRDVVRRTPADLTKHPLHPGDVILRIDGTEVGPDTNLAHVLTGDPTRQVELAVRSPSSEEGEAGEERTVMMRPASYRSIRLRLYDEWLDHNRRLVDELSGGRLGYLHVRGMNWSSFHRFEEELYKAGHAKDGLVIDVRNNGGGFTADHLLTSLTQPVHAFAVGRGGGPGYPQDRMVYARWRKPIVVLCNQNSFSNAEIFAHAIKTLKRGPVVGVRTAGGVISTGGTRVLDVGSIRLPTRGWFLFPGGEDMELNGCRPDHVVWPEPTEIPEGKDRQLEKGVEVLLDEVKAEEARPPFVPKPASTRRGER